MASFLVDDSQLFPSCDRKIESQSDNWTIKKIDHFFLYTPNRNAWQRPCLIHVSLWLSNFLFCFFVFFKPQWHCFIVQFDELVTTRKTADPLDHQTKPPKQGLPRYQLRSSVLAVGIYFSFSLLCRVQRILPPAHSR